ncbi:MAG: GTPase Era [Bilifractor sp.]|jgi:GTP-binding protein Era
MENTPQTKSGFVALIGRPNVGKSTLMNHIIGQKIAITSRKPQTTRNRIQTVYNCERGQIVFLDTPGIHKAKNRLGEYMVYAAEHTIRDVDAVLWLVEPHEAIGPGERHIASMLTHSGLPVILVINKIDTVKKAEIPEAIERFRGLCPFVQIIPASAKQSRNLDTILDTLFQYLPYGPRFFDENTVTDQPVRQIAAELIREKALRSLGEEVPHGIAVTIERMKTREDGRITDIDATIICERDSHKGIIIGKNGSMLKKIGSEARPEIEQLLETKVNLKLWVKVRKNWRDSDVLMKNYGYDRKRLSE